MAFIRPTKKQIQDTLTTWWRRAPRPVFSAAIYFAIGEIMNMSGYSMVSGKFETASMVKVLADNSALYFQHAYGFVVAFIGLFGGFITGSEASTVAMFAKYTLTTAKKLNLDMNGMIMVAAGLAFGGGLASVISPAKLQNAAASIDKLGEENRVIKVAFVFALFLTLITALFVMVMLKWVAC
jgi:lactate permease